MTDDHDLTSTFKIVMDTAAAGVGFMSWVSVELFPVVLQILSAVWLMLRIYEVDTVQRWLGRKRD
jgi:hypothetical protein